MATVTTYLTAKKDCQVNDAGAFIVTKKVTVPTTVAQNDYVQFVELPCGLRLDSAQLQAAGTLGASCVATLYHNRAGVRTALTGATTAGGASKISSNAIAAVPIDCLVGDILEVQFTGAAVGTAAVVAVDAHFQRA